MSKPSVIRYDTNGPAGIGLTPWEPMDPDTLTDGVAEQRGHEYFLDSTGTLSSGVWDCTAHTEKLAPYPVNEFMIVLEGSVSIIDQRGHEETMYAGQSFVIPKAMPCVWKQSEYVRKFYVIFDDPSGAVSPDPDALQVIRPDPSATLPVMEQTNTSRYLGDVPTHHLLQVFGDPTGQMLVGLWDTNEMHTRLEPFPRNELMHILEGTVTVSGGDGSAQTFAPGDTFMVPKGTEYRWDSEGFVKKIYCMFIPGES